MSATAIIGCSRGRESLSGSSSADACRGHQTWRGVLRQFLRNLTRKDATFCRPARNASSGLHGESASRAPGLPQAACLRSTTATRTPAARALEPTRRWEAAGALTLSAVQTSWLRTYQHTHAGADACRTGAQGASAQCDERQAARCAVRRHSPAPVCPGAGKPVRRQGRHTKRWGVAKAWWAGEDCSRRKLRQGDIEACSRPVFWRRTLNSSC